MLTTNTGSALGDSGDAYGRHWQRNQKKTMEDFKKDPSVSIGEITEHDTDSKDIQYTISVFHYLTSGSLELDEICDEYNALPCKDWESEIYGVSKEQADWFERSGFTIKESFNTYNGESSLSQVLQGTYCESGLGDPYVLLQVHQGCDVRGGYTDAKLFRLSDEWMPSEEVYGTITTDREEYQVTSSYNGTSITDDNGNAVPLNEQSIISLYLCEY